MTVPATSPRCGDCAHMQEIHVGAFHTAAFCHAPNYPVTSCSSARLEHGRCGPEARLYLESKTLA